MFVSEQDPGDQGVVPVVHHPAKEQPAQARNLGAVEGTQPQVKGTQPEVKGNQPQVKGDPTPG